MLLGEAPETADEPFCGKVRRRADGEHAGALPLKQPLGADSDAIEGVAQDREVLPTCVGDDQTLAFAVEELDSEFEFQSLHLMADGALGDKQFLGRPRKTLVSGSGLEGFQ